MNLVRSDKGALVPNHPFSISCDDIEHCLGLVGLTDKNINPDFVLANSPVLNELLYPICRSIVRALNDSGYSYNPQIKTLKRIFRESDEDNKFSRFVLGPMDTYSKLYSPYSSEYLDSNETLADNVINGRVYGVGIESVNSKVKKPGFVPTIVENAYKSWRLSQRTPTRSIFLTVDVGRTNGFETTNPAIRDLFRFTIHGQLAESEYLNDLILIVMQTLVDFVDSTEIYTVQFKQGDYIKCYDRIESDYGYM